MHTDENASILDGKKNKQMNIEERIKKLEDAFVNLETKCIELELTILELDRRSHESERRSLESDRRIIEVLSNITGHDFSDMRNETLKQANQQIDTLSHEIDSIISPEIERLRDLLEKANNKSGEL